MWFQLTTIWHKHRKNGSRTVSNEWTSHGKIVENNQFHEMEILNFFLCFLVALHCASERLKLRIHAKIVICHNYTVCA